MFDRAFNLVTVSGLALHSALLAGGCCGDDTSVMSCAFEDGIQIEATSIEAVASTPDSWDCCGLDTGPWCFDITIQPIYWLNAHQESSVGQTFSSVARGRTFDPTTDLYREIGVRDIGGRVLFSPGATAAAINVDAGSGYQGQKVKVKDDGTGPVIENGKPVLVTDDKGNPVLAWYGPNGKQTTITPGAADPATGFRFGREIGNQNIITSTRKSQPSDGHQFYAMGVSVEEQLASSVMNAPLFWGWGANFELAGRAANGNLLLLSLLGFYSKNDWSGSGGSMDVSMLPKYWGVAPFVPYGSTQASVDAELSFRPAEYGLGFFPGGEIFFNSIDINDKTWFWQAQFLSGVDIVLSSSSKVGCRFGLSGLYATWDRDGVANVALNRTQVSEEPLVNQPEGWNSGLTTGFYIFGPSSIPDTPIGARVFKVKGVDKQLTKDEFASYKEGKLGDAIITDGGVDIAAVTFENDNKVYGGGLTFGLSAKTDFCGMSIYGNGATTLYFAKEEASRMIGSNSFLSSTAALIGNSFVYPETWRMFPVLDLGVGLEWDCAWFFCCCMPLSVQLGWEQHIALNMFTDFVLKDSVFPELGLTFATGDGVTLPESDGQNMLGGVETRTTHAQRYDVVRTSYIMGGPTLRITTSF